MKQTSIEKRLPKYHKIYEQVYENPLIPIYQITKNTGISRSTVSRYLQEMYALSIISGPAAFVKPAKTYRQVASFLRFEHSLSTFKSFEGFPKVTSRTLTCGSWNLMLVSESFLNFSVLKGFGECVHQDVKGVTLLSKVTSLDWGTSMEKMYNALSQPKKRSLLYEELPHLPWKHEEWTLYHGFRDNVRIDVMPVLKECGLRFERYQTWFSELPQYADIRAAFYPRGSDTYFIFDFLLKSDYQEQLAEILGMLPSTCAFFSVGDYLFARLTLLTKKEKDELFTFIYALGEEDFFTDLHHAQAITTNEP